ncbi:hypothetical protein H1C71_032257, partial [Ictidomys tridecemlineatus]
PLHATVAAQLSCKSSPECLSRSKSSVLPHSSAAPHPSSAAPHPRSAAPQLSRRSSLASLPPSASRSAHPLSSARSPSRSKLLACDQRPVPGETEREVPGVSVPPLFPRRSRWTHSPLLLDAAALPTWGHGSTGMVPPGSVALRRHEQLHSISAQDLALSRLILFADVCLHRPLETWAPRPEPFPITLPKQLK